jgi:hypothetical protein
MVETVQLPGIPGSRCFSNLEELLVISKAMKTFKVFFKRVATS